MEIIVSQHTDLMVWLGDSEARNETYNKYVERALEQTTPPELKNAWQSFWLSQKAGQA